MYRTGPFSVDKRIVPSVPFICRVRPSRQALRHCGALHDIGVCPEVSSRIPERKFSGSETAIGPLMVRASNCDPFQVSDAKCSAIGPFCAVKCTSPRSPENAIGPLVVCASTLPPQSAMAMGPLVARNLTLPFTPRTSIGPLRASRSSEASRGAWIRNTAIHSAESPAGPLYETRPAVCPTLMPRTASSATPRVPAAAILQVSTE
jgi:hypothetical protein